MGEIASVALNTCTNCGAQAEYNYLTNTNICKYCGSEFKVSNQKNETSERVTGESTGCIPFKLEIQEVREKLLHWLIEGDLTPLKILTGSTFDKLYKNYLPFYIFTGTYDGYYNVESKNGRLISENTRIQGDFKALTFAGTHFILTYSSELMALSGNNGLKEPFEDVDFKSIVPVQNLDMSGIVRNAFMDEPEAWEKQGKLKAAEQVYKKLKAQNPDSNYVYKHYLNYNLQSVAKVYVPYWQMSYTWSEDFFKVYLDDASGRIIGIKPIEQVVEIPNKKEIIKKYAKVGLCIWVAYWFVRAFFVLYGVEEAGSNKNSPNNLIFSPIGGFYWFTRGIILSLGIPFLMTVVNNRLVKRNFTKLKKLRQQSLDLILTGKAPNVF